MRQQDKTVRPGGNVALDVEVREIDLAVPEIVVALREPEIHCKLLVAHLLWRQARGGDAIQIVLAGIGIDANAAKLADPQ